MFGASRRGVDGPGGRRRGDSLDKGDVYRERSPLDDRGRDRGDRYKYSVTQCCVPLCDCGTEADSGAATCCMFWVELKCRQSSIGLQKNETHRNYKCMVCGIQFKLFDDLSRLIIMQPTGHMQPSRKVFAALVSVIQFNMHNIIGLQNIVWQLC